MRFHKKVPLENRELLTAQLKQYEKETKMTSEERRELHKWVASGRSPYDNGDYIYGENGWPVDFVSALRFVDEQAEWFESLSEEEQNALCRKNTAQYDTSQEEPVFFVSSFADELELDEELPFQ
jgi:hypothetical protein